MMVVVVVMMIIGEDKKVLETKSLGHLGVCVCGAAELESECVYERTKKNSLQVRKNTTQHTHIYILIITLLTITRLCVTGTIPFYQQRLSLSLSFTLFRA